jgi:hypothetical protein
MWSPINTIFQKNKIHGQGVIGDLLKNIKLISIGLLLNACCGSPFSGIECNNEDYLHFIIVSQTGENLFEGTSPKYVEEDLKLFTIKDAARIELENLWLGSDGEFSTMVDYRFATIFVEIQGQPRDTLGLRFNVKNDQCCGLETRIDSVVVNGVSNPYYSGSINLQIVD